MSLECCKCSSPAASDFGSPFCNSCERALLPPNLCCIVCHIHSPKLACTCTFPLPLLCPSCTSDHQSKNTKGSHQLHPICIIANIHTSEDLLKFSQRIAGVEYVKMKLNEETLKAVKGAQTEFMAYVENLKSQLQVQAEDIQRQLRGICDSVVMTISNLNAMKYCWREAKTECEYFSLHPELIPTNKKFSYFQYQINSQFTVANLFYCSFSMPPAPNGAVSPPLQPSRCPDRYKPAPNEAVPPPQQSSRHSARYEPVPDPNLALSPAFRTISSTSPAPNSANRVPAVQSSANTCLYCKQKLTPSANLVRLNCSHMFHDKDCLFCFLMAVSRNFTSAYCVSCPNCNVLQGMGDSVGVHFIGEREFAQRKAQVQQTACCVCGTLSVVLRWRCSHRLCQAHIATEFCMICQKRGEIQR